MGLKRAVSDECLFRLPPNPQETLACLCSKNTSAVKPRRLSVRWKLRLPITFNKRLFPCRRAFLECRSDSVAILNAKSEMSLIRV